MMMKKCDRIKGPTFPIPCALHDLESAPYNLLPYPENFDDDDEAARAESFDALVFQLEDGNRIISSATIVLFEPEDEDEEPWNDEERMQAIYTLVRKASSLAIQTKKRLIDILCEAVLSLHRILNDFATSLKKGEENAQQVVSEEFRAAFSFHVYMLYSMMFSTESEAKGSSDIREKGNKVENVQKNALRLICAEAMSSACIAMCEHKSHLWQRGVGDEAVIMLPCRIAYQMLESATGLKARKAVCGDIALKMLAITIDSFNNMLSQIVVALIDLLHAYEHMASLVAELCGMVNENPSNRLGIELIREIGRLKPSVESHAGGKASGIKNLAPFISELAKLRPRLVMNSASQILPHLDSEPYIIRSAVVAALGHILVYIGSSESSAQNNEDMHTTTNHDLSKSRNSLLKVLTKRILDVSSYTRTAVLKSWISIVKAGALPIDQLMSVTTIAADRLMDKTVMVRRYAMQLLTAILEHNPFLGSLDPKPYQDKLAEVYEKVQESMPTDIKDARETSRKDAEDDETRRKIDEAALAAAIADAESMEQSDELSDKDAEFRSYVKALKFTQSALDFINKFEYANEACQCMLLSKNTSDVTEALRFFVKARHFQLPCAVSGMKHALALMWSSEQSIQDEVLQAFVEIFLCFPGTDGKENLPHDQIAHNLLILVGHASISELASIEEALCKLVKSESIPANVFTILWSIAGKSKSDTRAASLMVLSMAASADRLIVDSASRLRLLLEVGLSDYVEDRNDWKVVRSAACALQRVSLASMDPISAKAVVLEHIIERLCIIIRGDWCVDEKRNDTLTWFSAAEQSIDALFVVSEEPEVECADIIRKMTGTTFGYSGEKKTLCHSLRLARFFFVLGHIALKLLVHTEYLSSSLLRANAKKSLKQQEIADDANERKKAEGVDVTMSNNEAIEAELGVAAEIEAENERRFADISEQEILGRGIIENFIPLLVRVIGNDGGNFKSDILQQTSTLALCKFMCISSSFCEKHLPLVFATLANAPSQDTTLRANIVVGLGDLAYRFPNEVEPYTPRLYACLRDSSTKVRRHTLMVLTHLILNDMVKVKGQVCEIAVCLRDDDARIRDMSRLLFYTLSKRSNNPIYNLLPDIISQLSQNSVKKEDFRNIMSFLLAFIKKERQNDMLIEKLCQRFPKCQSISQKSDLTFCIAQLKVNEKSVKHLIEKFGLYKDALFDDEVRKTFLSIVSKAKKFAKPELKESIVDWEAKLNNHSILGQENEAVSEKASRAKAKAAKRANKKNKKKTRSASQKSPPVIPEGNKENIIC